MINKELLFSNFFILLGRITRKIASLGFTLPNKIHNSIVTLRLQSIHSNLISQYKTIEYVPIPQTDNYPIWVFWWQGVNKMPELVRICYNSIVQNAGEHPVHLLTENNYEQYLSKLPHLKEILNRIQQRTVSYAYFSDIIRSYLLYEYGGVWIDATVLL